MTSVYVLIVVAVALGIYYFVYYKRIQAAGGSKAAGKTYWREQFGLDPDEDVVSMGMGMWYLGPLVPETMQSKAAQVFDAITGTSYRGAMLWLAFTSKERFAMAVEETEDGPKSERPSLGLKSGYAPLAIYDVAARPRIELAEQAWPGSDKLPKDSQKPKMRNFNGQSVRFELIRMTEPSGHAMVFFVEPEWVEAVDVWCGGGPPRIEKRYVE